jgi:hypothetical protein
MKKNMKALIIFLFTILLFTSCSLRVNKNITKSYPPQVPDSTFKVYFSEAPENAEIIGTISVLDGGMTMTCDSATVFNLAKVEAGQAGGNALMITDYKKPAIWESSCHQVIGMILKIPDAIKSEEFFSGLATSSDSLITKDTTAIKMVKFEKPRYLPRMIFSLDGGYGWRTAKIDPNLNYEEKDFLKHLMSGFVWDASATYIFKNNYGIKLTYLQYFASHSANGYDLETYQTGTLSESQTISYVGPAFAGYDAFGKDKNWILGSYVGLGYIMYYDKATFINDYITITGAKVGFQFGIEIEHKINPNFGIGLNAELVSGVLMSWEVNKNGKKQTYTTNDVNNGIGLGQFRIMAGIRYYIK